MKIRIAKTADKIIGALRVAPHVFEKIEKSLEESARFGEITSKYKDLIHALIAIKKAHRINQIDVKEVSLPEYWYKKYPSLVKDLKEVGLAKRLLGFNLNLI